MPAKPESRHEGGDLRRARVGEKFCITLLSCARTVPSFASRRSAISATVSPVPLPASALRLLSGVGALAVTRRRPEALRRVAAALNSTPAP